MSESSRSYIEGLPKAELHLHLEGSIQPATFLRLARKYDSEYASATEEALRKELFQYDSLRDFLEAYKVVCTLLREPEDYLLLLEDLETYFLDHHILHAEIIYCPAIPWKFGLDGRGILEALLQESRRFTEKTGVSVRWILDAVRQFGRESAERTAEIAAEFVGKGVVAVGLGGDEESLPADEFEEVFAWVRAHQLFVHVHAGEVGGPEVIWDAVETLGANRVGHGIQAARDPELMSYLKEHAVGLDVCLTSNAATKAWPILKQHPLPLLYKRGVPVTLNTDDPGMFQTTLSSEMHKAVAILGLEKSDLHHVILQGARSSFLPHGEKMALMQRFSDLLRAQ